LEKIFNLLGLETENKLEKAESYSILSLIIGSMALSLGIGLSILNTKGLSAILTMLGSVLAFLSTLSLISVWLVKEWRSD